MKIMFVCLGNICRSPMAEAVFRHLVEQNGLSGKITTASCGTAGYHIGKPPHPGTREILTRNGISHAGIKASQLNPRHFSEYDGFVAMDKSNLHDILQTQDKNSTAWAKLLSDFCEEKWGDVPDPWYTGDFEETYKLVTQGCKRLLKWSERNPLRHIDTSP